MGFGAALTFYAVIGLGVAAADYLAADAADGGRWLRAATAAMFWPLFLPVLLSRPAPESGPAAVAAEPCDRMSAAIAQVELELDAALSSLDGWAENVLSREKDRLGELRAALAAQAARIREMDSLIAGFDDEPEAAPAWSVAAADESIDRCQQSERARRQNLARLRGVRRQAHDDLMGTLAWVRELVSMIHLAKFTGAPASRAEELVAQIAAAVEGVSELRMKDAGTKAEFSHPISKEL